jgi:hypothetical protein
MVMNSKNLTVIDVIFSNDYDFTVWVKLTDGRDTFLDVSVINDVEVLKTRGFRNSEVGEYEKVRSEADTNVYFLNMTNSKAIELLENSKRLSIKKVNELEQIKAESALFVEKMKNRIDDLCNEMDNVNGSNLSHVRDRLTTYMEELNEYNFMHTHELF